MFVNAENFITSIGTPNKLVCLGTYTPFTKQIHSFNKKKLFEKIIFRWKEVQHKQNTSRGLRQEIHTKNRFSISGNNCRSYKNHQFPNTER